MATTLPLSEEKIKVLAKELGLTEKEIIKESLRALLERKLKEIKAEINLIKAKYKISSVEEFEGLYKEGKIEEKDSFEDFKKLYHLEFKEEELEKILEELK